MLCYAMLCKKGIQMMMNTESKLVNKENATRYDDDDDDDSFFMQLDVQH
jgi:hypothetical protein